MYDTEKNRVKVAKFRIRRGLKDAGYSPEQIADIIDGIDWQTETPGTILARYIEDRPAPARDRVTIARAIAAQEEEDDEEEDAQGDQIELPAWVPWAGLGLGVLGCIGFLIAIRPEG